MRGRQQFFDATPGVENGACNGVDAPLDELLSVIAEQQPQRALVQERKQSLLLLLRAHAHRLGDLAFSMEPAPERIQPAQPAVARHGLDPALAKMHHEVLKVGPCENRRVRCPSWCRRL